MAPAADDYAQFIGDDERLVAEGGTQTPVASNATIPGRRVAVVCAFVFAFSTAAVALARRPAKRASDLALLGTLPGGPAMVHLSQIAALPRPPLAGAQGSRSFLDDVAFSRVPGKEMTAGFYELFAGPALNYTYTYEEFKFIVDGEFHLVDGTGQQAIARKGDLMYFPRGTNVVFTTPEHALGYFVGQRGEGEASVVVDDAVREAMASNPRMVHLPQIAHSRLPKLPGSGPSLSFLGDLGFSDVARKEMTAGLYRELAGPPLHYTYTYEELKYIAEGEFHLTDGTGQQVVATKGDLVYFPNGTQVIFHTPLMALGFFCGQRRGGEE